MKVGRESTSGQSLNIGIQNCDIEIEEETSSTSGAPLSANLYQSHRDTSTQNNRELNSISNGFKMADIITTRGISLYNGRQHSTWLETEAEPPCAQVDSSVDIIHQSDRDTSIQKDRELNSIWNGKKTANIMIPRGNSVNTETQKISTLRLRWRL
jgi:hypothetical protein